MSEELTNMTVAFLVAPEGVEQVELTAPWEAVRDAGGTPRLVSTQSGEVQAFHHLDKGDTFRVDDVIDDSAGSPRADLFDALVLPGGVANPDFLRTQPAVVRFVTDFATSPRPVAVICHGPWTLVESGVLSGRTLTSWPSLQTDIRNAGGHWVDEEVHVDTEGPGALVSSRKPDDLKTFCATLVEQFAAVSR